MKKTISVIVLLVVLVFTYVYREQIINFIADTVINKNNEQLEYRNAYYLDYNFGYVKEIDNLNISNKKDLMNLYFTIINSGANNFEFYCPKSYENCVNDIIDIANDPKDLSDINGFVHPFNSFDTIETSYDSIGRVKVKIIKTYTDLEIDKLNKKVVEIVTNEVKEEKDPKKIIKIIHDYIINNTKYDKDRTDGNIIKYASNTAYGVLFEGYGICSGYADAMALFLDYYQIPNYKIASENHVWNAVYVDNNWYHLDLTWDDPILNNGDDKLQHDYFLITTKQLKALNDTQHIFNEEIFKELSS